MQLKELAQIRRGDVFKKSDLMTRIPAKINYVNYLIPENLLATESTKYFIHEKDLRNKNIPNKNLINYGDYLIYKKDKIYTVVRYTSTSGKTLPGEGFFIVTSDFSIVKDFLSLPKNVKYLQTKFKEFESNGKLTVENIGNIEINTDDIRELEDLDKAEQMGLRNPLGAEDTSAIRITQKPLPLDKLVKRIIHNELLLDTEFQRRPGLWDIGVKSRLIESMIIKLPIPAFYFDASDDNKWLVIDGLQRLSAVKQYVNDEEFELTSLDYLPHLEGKKFSELERQYQRNIEEYEVYAYILESGTPKPVIYKIFKSINTSSLQLVPQEIRHAINPGVPAQFLKEVADKDWFKKFVQISDTRKERMYDRETVLRFIAFQRNKYNEYNPGIVDFLDSAMTDIYNIPFHERQLYTEQLNTILKTLFEIFGETVFSRSFYDYSKAYNFNAIIFELWTYGLSRLSSNQLATLVKNRTKVKDMAIDFFKRNNHIMLDSDLAYTKDGLKKRFEEMELFIKKILSV